jgi:hypothetical protein
LTGFPFRKPGTLGDGRLKRFGIPARRAEVHPPTGPKRRRGSGNM